MNFMERLHIVLNDIKKYTENGAVGYATTGKALVDLNFAVASLRSADENDIITRFIPAFYEDRVLAMKWLFFMRDARGGLGERRTFRIIIRYLANGYSEMVASLVEIMSEYGRYDDMLCLMDTPVEEQVISYIAEQISEDIENMKREKSISLCAKWMPGNNTSSAESRNIAMKLQKHMGLTSKQYRKMLAELRAYLGVIEVYMSDNRWEEIDYSAVPSKANILYRNAFMEHDKVRREEFLNDVVGKKAVMHADVLMPHDIAARYIESDGWRLRVGALDVALETLLSD